MKKGKSNAEEMKVEKKTQKRSTKKCESSSSEEISSSESDKEQIKKNAKVSVLKFGRAVSNQSTKEDTSDDSDEDSSDQSDSEEENPSKEEESSEVSSSDNEEHQKKKIKIEKVAKKASSSSSDEESDSPEELPFKTVEKSDTDVKMEDVPSSSLAKKQQSQNPITPKATGSKTLFMGNLSDSIEKYDVISFFKDAGEIAEVRFSVRENQFAGYGHIEFSTAEAAHEALKLNNKMLKGRPVTVDLAKERGAFTPGSSNKKPFQERKQAQGTVFVRGFDASDSIENIKSSLQNHFEICGEIIRIIVPRDYESGLPKGTAYIDFVERNGIYPALDLDGSYIKGRMITVDDARPITDSLGDENDESTGGFDGGRVRESGRFGSGNYFGGRYSGVNIGGWIGGRCGKDNVGKFNGGRRPYPGARCGSDYARKYREINRPSVAPRGTGKKTVFNE